MNKLKRAIIKEELVALTGDFKSAIVLNQMLYWSERTKDAKTFLKEEEERLKISLGKEFNEEYILDDFKHGWIYKSSEELSNECMINASVSTIRRYLKQLIENGWVDERRNPKYKCDKTMQYRVNIYKIQSDLFKIGYVLDGYPIQMALLSNFQNETSKLQNEKSSFQNETSKLQNEKAIPEITTENTSEIKKHIYTAEAEEIYSLYPRKVGKKKAINKIIKYLKAGTSKEELIKCVERYSKEVQGRKKEFIKNADTFFNGYYEDYLDCNYEEPILEVDLENSIDDMANQLKF